MDVMVCDQGGEYIAKDVKKQHSKMPTNRHASLPRKLTKIGVSKSGICKAGSSPCHRSSLFQTLNPAWRKGPLETEWRVPPSWLQTLKSHTRRRPTRHSKGHLPPGSVKIVIDTPCVLPCTLMDWAFGGLPRIWRENQPTKGLWLKQHQIQ